VRTGGAKGLGAILRRGHGERKRVPRCGVVIPSRYCPLNYVPTNASLIFALYAASRAIPLAMLAFVAIYLKSRSALFHPGWLSGVAKLCDAGVGFVQHDIGKTVGPLVISLLQFAAICLLSRSTSHTKS
jgi:hypothetical protein